MLGALSGRDAPEEQGDLTWHPSLELATETRGVYAGTGTGVKGEEFLSHSL